MIARSLGTTVVVCALTACGAPLESSDDSDTEASAEEALLLGSFELASVSSRGLQGDLDSSRPALSGNGRVVGFISRATQLVEADGNGVDDAFARDRLRATTSRVSVSSGGVEGNGLTDVFPPALDRHGRYVAFESLATNLAPGDANQSPDVFLHDRESRSTVRVSVASDGTEANGGSAAPSLDAAGRLVAFVSLASNLVPGDTNGFADVFVRDLRRETTERISVSSDGAEGDGDAFSVVELSGNGRFVAFATRAGNLTAPGSPGVCVHDRRRGTTELASVSSAGLPGDQGGGAGGLGISFDGRFVVFDSNSTNLVSADTNGVSDIFVRDRRTRRTERVSVGPRGVQANGPSTQPSVSGDGRFVVFISTATNLDRAVSSPESHAYLFDRLARRTTLLSRARNGSPGDGPTLSVAISDDGGSVALWSLAENLVRGDVNGVSDVFVADTLAPRQGRPRLSRRHHRH